MALKKIAPIQKLSRVIHRIWSCAWSNWLIYCAVALILSASVLALIGVIPKVGHWYSASPYYRLQTDRLIHGNIALAESPSGMRWDLAWADGKIQQVWGLGVPLLRLPLEMIARLLGKSMFPDRIVFAILFFIVTCFSLNFHFWNFRIGDSRTSSMWSMLTLFNTILFPPFLALCSSRFLVYEESVAYGFLLCSLLMIWAASLWIEPRGLSFLALALISGLLPFVRPTFVFYGISSVGLVAIRFLGRPKAIRVLLGGTGLFVFGITLLLWSNMVRFGDCLEFGHSLILNSDDAMRFASRFGYPFHEERLVSAARELFALLFQTRSLLTSDPYGSHLFPGQSSTFRWRELYFSTYDISIFIMVSVAWIWVLCRLCHSLLNRQALSKLSIIEFVSLWSLFGAAPLFGLYFRFPFISSRYLLDFGPAFAAGCWVFTFLTMSRTEYLGRFRSSIKFGVLILFIVWWGYQMVTIDSAQDKSDSAATGKRASIQCKAYLETKPSQAIPSYYTNGFPFETLGIPFNGSGWDDQTGITAVCVPLFIKDPDCLILDLTLANPATLGVDYYEAVQAKIGLEYLQRSAVAQTATGMRITFNGPKKKQYQTGIQVAFLAFVKPSELAVGNSPFRLLKVRWHRETTAATTP